MYMSMKGKVRFMAIIHVSINFSIFPHKPQSSGQDHLHVTLPPGEICLAEVVKFSSISNNAFCQRKKALFYKNTLHYMSTPEIVF